MHCKYFDIGVLNDLNSVMGLDIFIFNLYLFHMFFILFLLVLILYLLYESVLGNITCEYNIQLML